MKDDAGAHAGKRRPVQGPKKAGFKFVGSTICYAFMQASGMVDDHVVGCHRYRE